MNGWNTRVRLFDKKQKTMLPSAPLYKTNFYNCETEKYLIMFSTGLKDKNGKEIYEGDILNSKNDGSDGCYVWDYTDHVNLIVKWHDKYCCFTEHDIKRIEVVGNIYENPESIKSFNK